MPVEPSTLLEKLTALARRRGFVFQSSEIYGGGNGTWDYGPLGVRSSATSRTPGGGKWSPREDIVGLDAAILMHPKVWKTSGHVADFTDPDGRLEAVYAAVPRGRSGAVCGQGKPSDRVRERCAELTPRANST